MQLVADPSLLVALAVLLCADITAAGEVREHLADVLRRLTLEARRLRLGPFFRWLLALFRASALLLRLGVSGGRPAGGPRRRIVLLVLLHRLLARLDLSGVARDRADHASPERALDQRRVHLAGQITLRERREGAGKRGFRRNLRASLPPKDPAQRLIDVKTLDEVAGGQAAPWRRRPWPARADLRAADRLLWAARERRLPGRPHREW